MVTSLVQVGAEIVAPTETVEEEIEYRIKEWVAYLERNMSHGTVDVYQKGFGLFFKWLASESAAALASLEAGDANGNMRDLEERAELNLKTARAKHLEQWRQSLKEAGYAKASVNLWLVGTKSFYAFMVAAIQEETRTLIPNPMIGVKGLKTKRNGNGRHKRDRLTSEEIKNLFATCSGDEPKNVRDRSIISLMAYGALRTIEIHRADSEDMRTDGDVRILEVMGKGETEKNDFIVLHPNAEKAIDQWMEIRGPKSGPLFTSLSRSNFGDRLSTRSIRAMVKHRFKKAGIVGSRKSTHSLRHSAITSAIEGGATPLQVMAMARHASFDTTMAYYHNASRTKEPAEFLIDYGFDLFEKKNSLVQNALNKLGI